MLSENEPSADIQLGIPFSSGSDVLLPTIWVYDAKNLPFCSGIVMQVQRFNCGNSSASEPEYRMPSDATYIPRHCRNLSSPPSWMKLIPRRNPPWYAFDDVTSAFSLMIFRGILSIGGSASNKVRTVWIFSSEWYRTDIPVKDRSLAQVWKVGLRVAWSNTSITFQRAWYRIPFLCELGVLSQISDVFKIGILQKTNIFVSELLNCGHFKTHSSMKFFHHMPEHNQL